MTDRAAWMDMNYGGPTPSLAEFLVEYEKDNNVFWMLPSGHHQNLLEEALQRLLETRVLLERYLAATGEVQALATTGWEIAKAWDEGFRTAALGIPAHYAVPTPD